MFPTAWANIGPRDANRGVVLATQTNTHTHILCAVLTAATIVLSNLRSLNSKSRKPASRRARPNSNIGARIIGACLR